MKKIFSVFGLILIFSFAVILDRLYDTILPTAVESRQILSLSLVQIAEIVFITALLMGLAWYILYFGDRSLWIALIYVILGGFVSIFTTLSGYYSLSNIINSPSLHQWYVSVMTSQTVLTQHAGVFAMLIGIARLLPDRLLWNKG